MFIVFTIMVFPVIHFTRRMSDLYIFGLENRQIQKFFEVIFGIFNSFKDEVHNLKSHNINVLIKRLHFIPTLFTNKTNLDFVLFPTYL